MDHTGLSIESYPQLWLIWAEKCKTKSTKGKGTCGRVWKEPGSNFQESCPSGITQGVLNSCSNKLWQRVSNACLPGKVIRDSTPRVFFEYWSYRYPLSGTYQHSRFAREKQAGIQHEPHSKWTTFLSSGNGGELPKVQVPRCVLSQPCNQVFLSRAVPGLLCYFFSIQPLLSCVIFTISIYF